MKDYIIFLLMIRLPQGTAITIFGNEKLTLFSLQGIQEYFETIHLECQEISFNRGGTVIQKQGIPEL